MPANNVSFSPGEYVAVAIAHIPNNEFRNTNVGMIMALRSPQSAKLINDTNPLLASKKEGADRNIFFKKSGNDDVLGIKLNYLPAQKNGYRTTVTAVGGATGSNGVSGVLVPPAPIEILFNKTLEIELQQSFFDGDIFKTETAINYMSNLLKDRVARRAAMNNPEYAHVFNAFTQVGLTILARANDDILVPMNDICITEYLSGVGKNAAYPTAATPSAAAPIIDVEAFEADGERPYIGLRNFIRKTMVANKFSGKPIVVGGYKMVQYITNQNVVSVASNGFVLDKIIGDTPVEFYYDERFDSIAGANVIGLHDSGAACLQTWKRYGSDPRINPITAAYHANMYYDNLKIDLSQYNNDLVGSSNVPSTLSLEFDFRAKQALDTKDRPVDYVALTANFGVFKRPVGFFHSDNTNPLYGVTGIYLAKLVNKA